MHTLHTRHSSQHIQPHMPGTPYGLHSAPDPRRKARTHRLCRPCQRHSSHTMSLPSSACRRHRRSCTSHQIQQRTRRTEHMPSARRWHQCRQGIAHRCHRSQHTQPHSPGTSADQPWALSPQHTGCTLRCPQPIQVHTAGTQSCLRSAQCHPRTQRRCRPIQRSHQHSSHTPPH